MASARSKSGSQNLSHGAPLGTGGALVRREGHGRLKRHLDEVDAGDIELVLASQGLSSHFILTQTTPLLGLLAAVPCIALVGRTLGLGLVPGFVVPLAAVMTCAIAMGRRSLKSELTHHGFEEGFVDQIVHRLTPQVYRTAKRRAGWGLRATLWPSHEDKFRLAAALLALLREPSHGLTHQRSSANRTAG